VLPNPEGFEGGWGDWYADNGVWEIGRPTSGPGGAHGGTQVAATTLAGNYSDYSQPSRLISPSFVVPSAGELPRLRFWHWFKTPHEVDFGKVQIRRPGGGWVDVSPKFFLYGGQGGLGGLCRTDCSNRFLL
jgi:hypothetical protein